MEERDLLSAGRSFDGALMCSHIEGERDRGTEGKRRENKRLTL